MIELYNEDCLKTMKRIKDGSIDLMLTDIPYGTTQNKWDILPNLAKMWDEWERILKPDGVWAFTAQQPTTSIIINHKLDFFRYEMVWIKNVANGFLNKRWMPMRKHENVIIFYKEKPTYNPQKSNGTPYKSKRKHRSDTGDNYNEMNRINTINSGFREPTTLLNFNVETGKHPTQKPVDLFRYLIRSYSKEGETVYDGYSGSGTTAIACIEEKRNFIGSELDEKYFNKSMKRINIAQSQTKLF